MALPVAFTINATNPLFVAVFDYFVFGIRLNRTQMFWLALAFAGVILVVNGKALMRLFAGDLPDAGHFDNYLGNGPWTVIALEVLLVLTTGLLGLGVVLTKKLKSTNAFQINYFQGIMVVLVSSLFIPNAFSDAQYHKPGML